MRIHLICPVRNITEEQQKEIDEYARNLEKEGHIVHNPKYAVNQDDPTGWNICMGHLMSMEKSDRVDIFWDKNSKGSHFDFGMAFALKIPVKLVKIYGEDGPEKSYTKVIQQMEKYYGL
jgi:nucleoside 2-deoxyribosyltransferase